MVTVEPYLPIEMYNNELLMRRFQRQLIEIMNDTYNINKYYRRFNDMKYVRG